MVPEIGILTVIGLALMVTLYITKWWSDNHNEVKKEQDALDKKIDNANSITDFINIDDELHNK